MRRQSRLGERGFTLLEIVLVTALVVGLLSIMVYNFGPFREGQNVAICKTNLVKMQQTMRCFALLNNLSDGSALDRTAFIGNDKMMKTEPACKSGGSYSYLASVPAVGTMYASCSIAAHNQGIPNAQ